MNAENSANKNHDDSKSLLKILCKIVGPLAPGIILLIFEYWSGLFAQPRRLNILIPISLFDRVIFVVIVIAIFLLFAKDSLRIWLQQDEHLREDYAVAGSFAIVFLTFALLTILLTNLMPWNIGFAIRQVFFDNQVSVPGNDFSDYALLLGSYIATLMAIWLGYRRWEGGKSLYQYNLEQSGKSINIFNEALQELLRIARREPCKPYQVDRHKYITPLEAVTDSLAWKDQARELLRLSSSSYAFDPVEDWHDRPGCWLGSNVNTGDMVGLYPAQAHMDDMEIEDFVSYAKQIATDQRRKVDELIIAVKGDSVPTSKKWKEKKIRFETEAGLLDSLIDFGDYENEIRKRVLINHLPYSTLTLNDVYVPSQFSLALDDEKPHDNVEEYLCEWLEEPGQRQLALLGEYGQGKSTAALMLTYHLLFEKRQNSSRIPILIELRGRSPRNQTPLGLLGDWASQYRIEPQALMRLLIAGKLLLILEGFDEMALVGDAEMRLNHFRTLWQFCYPKAKILITGRPNLFLDDEELKAALGIHKPISNQPYCEALRLAPFDLTQIQKTLREHNTLVRNQICSLAEENKRFRELVARPSILHIVSVLWEREKLAEQVEKLNSAYVMDLFVRHSYRRQGLKATDAPGFMALTTLEREYFMRGIASYMASNDLPNQIDGPKLDKAIETLLEEIPDAVSTKSPAISGEIDQPLRLRIAATQYGLEHVKTDVRTCGILVDDPTSPGTFQFGHKSFMEYLFAAVLAEFISTEAPTSARAILKATKARIEDVLNLPVSIEFLAELIETDIQNRSHKESPSEDSERFRAEQTFATELFKVISGGGRLSLTLKRFSLFDETFRYSASHLPSVQRLIVLCLSPTCFILLIGPQIGILLMSYEKSSFLITSFFARSFAIVWTLAMMFIVWRQLRRLLAISTRNQKRELPVEGTLGLWNLICKKINIQDRVLHRIAGTWWLPWAKGRPFDYFLPKPRSDELTDN